jgi:hypothetical protein
MLLCVQIHGANGYLLDQVGEQQAVNAHSTLARFRSRGGVGTD